MWAFVVFEGLEIFEKGRGMYLDCNVLGILWRLWRKVCQRGWDEAEKVGKSLSERGFRVQYAGIMAGHHCGWSWS